MQFMQSQFQHQNFMPQKYRDSVHVEKNEKYEL